jgi:anti-sigma factor RsiW
VTCQEQDLVQGLVDGELDLANTLAVEEHLRGCQSCTQLYAEARALHSALSHSDLRFAATSDLEKRIRAGLRQQTKLDKPLRIFTWRLIAGAAALAVVVIVVWAPSSAPLRLCGKLFYDEGRRRFPQSRKETFSPQSPVARSVGR